MTPELVTILAIAAAAAPTAAQSSPPTVIVHVAEDDGPAAHELATLATRHGDGEPPAMRVLTPTTPGSRLAAARLSCTADVLAVFWLDAGREDEWRLYALPCAAGRPLVREIPVTPGAEQASIEAAWLITRASAVAIAEGNELAMAEADPTTIDRTPAPAPAPPPAPAPTPVAATAPPARTIGLRASLGYIGDALAREVPWQSGIAAALAYAPLRRFRVGAWYEFLAHARRDEPTGFALWRHGVAVTVAAVLPLPPRVAIEVRGGPELELSRWRSDAQGRGRLRTVPRIGADATVQIALGRGVGLDLGVGAAVALTDVDFVTCAASTAVCAGASRRTVVEPRRVRPRARAGISVQF